MHQRIRRIGLQGVQGRFGRVSVLCGEWSEISLTHGAERRPQDRVFRLAADSAQPGKAVDQQQHDTELFSVSVSWQRDD